MSWWQWMLVIAGGITLGSLISVVLISALDVLVYKFMQWLERRC